MKLTLVFCAALLLFAVVPAPAQETPESLVTTYDSLANAILGVEAAELGLVRSILVAHYEAAEAAFEVEKYEDAAAHMALFANEGDNAVAGIRKRLLEGGHHHHHAEEETAGVYEEGYVIVTREAKTQILAAASALRQAGDDAARRAAWNQFEAVAGPLTRK